MPDQPDQPDKQPPSPLSRPPWRAEDDRERKMTLEERHIQFLEGEIGRLESRLLSEAELIQVREIIDGDRKAKWLWGTVRTWALWVAAVVAGFTVGIDALRVLIKRLSE